MAITITTGLASDVAAFAPCVIYGSSTRAPILSTGVLESAAITAYGSGSGGRLAMSVAVGSGTSIEAGDTVIITGAEGVHEQYNGRHKVYTVTATTLTVEALYNGTDAGDAYGTMTRTNDSMRVRADVYNGSTLIGSLYAQPVLRNWEIDVSGLFQTQLSSIFSLTAGDRPTTGAAFAFTVELFEQWQTVDFSIIEVETVAAAQTGVAHRSADITGQITGTTLPSIAYRAKDKILHHFLCSETSNVSVIFIPYVGSTAGTATTVATTITNKHGLAVYAIPATATMVRIRTVWFDGSINEDIKDDQYIKVPAQTCYKRLYYTNAKGGFECVECPDWEDFTKTEKVDRYTVEAWTERRLTTVLEHKSTAAYLQDLPAAVEVYDENGTEVEMLSNDIQYYGENLQQEVTVKYERYIVK